MPTFSMSADARLIYARLMQAAPGETVPHQALAEAVSRPLAAIRGAITTAIRLALREHGAVFLVVRGVGYRRALPGDVVAAATGDTARIGRAARRGIRKLATVDHTALQPAEQITATVRMSMLALAAEAARETTASRLEPMAKGRPELPIAETLKALS